jgi:hypothetical protein
MRVFISHESVVALIQLLHVPLEPHAVVLVPAEQWLVESQQPEQLSHTQLEFMQRSPAAHCALLPHLQVPFTQVSACTESQMVAPADVPHTQLPVELQVSASAEHTWHMVPDAPHAVLLVCVTQVLPEQHPLHPLTVLQVHAWLMQTVPAPHAGPDPHLHTPPAQLSETFESHAFVLVPHTHLVPVQVSLRPPQLPVLPHRQLPKEQWSAALPQAPVMVPHTHLPPVQRSTSAVVHAPPLPHLQEPFTQLSTVMSLQAGLIPHMHIPLAQRLDRAGSHGTVEPPHTHVLLKHVSERPEHAGLEPHKHTPAEHWLALAPHGVPHPPQW